MKSDRILRADYLPHSMNGDKKQRLAQFIRDYRAVTVQIGHRQWRLFFESGSVNKYLPAKDLNYICGAAPVQMATQQGVEQIKSWMSNRANVIVEDRKPAELTIEHLNFRSPELSKRMNRIIQNCGRAVFKAKLTDLEECFGIVAHEVPSPYTSQECSSCGYVDRRNRRSQFEFLCRFCGMQKHADVNAACTVKGRRSSGLGDKFLTKGAI